MSHSAFIAYFSKHSVCVAPAGIRAGRLPPPGYRVGKIGRSNLFVPIGPRRARSQRHCASHGRLAFRFSLLPTCSLSSRPWHSCTLEHNSPGDDSAPSSTKAARPYSGNNMTLSIVAIAVRAALGASLRWYFATRLNANTCAGERIRSPIPRLYSDAPHSVEYLRSCRSLNIRRSCG